MKREHIKQQEQSYIDYLKSLDCCLYAPLTVDNDDLIQGATPDTYGSVSTRDDKGLYFNGSSGLKFSESLFSYGYDQSFTMICDFYMTQLTGSYYTILSFIKNSYHQGQTSCKIDIPNHTFYASINFRNWNNITGSSVSANVQYNKMGLEYDSSEHKFHIIQGGVISGNQNVAGIVSNDPLWIGSLEFNSEFMRGYMRNIMVFNRCLTQSELQQL